MSKHELEQIVARQRFLASTLTSLEARWIVQFANEVEAALPASAGDGVTELVAEWRKTEIERGFKTQESICADELEAALAVRDGAETTNSQPVNSSLVVGAETPRGEVTDDLSNLPSSDMCCGTCDGSGDVHRADGEWLCNCTECVEGINRCLMRALRAARPYVAAKTLTSDECRQLLVSAGLPEPENLPQSTREGAVEVLRQVNAVLEIAARVTK